MSSSLSWGKIILLHVVLIKVCSLNAGNAVFVSKDIDFEKNGCRQRQGDQ